MGPPLFYGPHGSLRGRALTASMGFRHHSLQCNGWRAESQGRREHKRFAIYPSQLPPGVSSGTSGPSGYHPCHFPYPEGTVPFFAFREFAETRESIKKTEAVKMNDIFKDAEVISTYTRAQAIDDG